MHNKGFDAFEFGDCQELADVFLDENDRTRVSVLAFEHEFGETQVIGDVLAIDQTTD
jgi:hypothetical protein